MKGITLALALALGTAVPEAASAQAEAGPLATARSIVAAVHVDRTLDTMFAQMMPLIVGNTLTAIDKASDTPASIKARIETTEGQQVAATVMSEELMKSFRERYPTIEAAVAEEYAKSFSGAELNAILAFCSSPTGRKMLEMQPQMQKTLSEAGRGIGREAAMEAIPKAMTRISAGAPTTGAAKAGGAPTP